MTKTIKELLSKLSFKEIEMTVQMKHFNDSDFGNSKAECEKLIEKTRNKIGYTKEDVEKYLTK